VAAVKRQLRANPAGTLDAALDVERDTQSLLGASVEYRNAVLHFSRPRTCTFILPFPPRTIP
jgi:hypothetical protein